MRADHIVLDGDECKCIHCGASYRINMPVPVSIFEAIAKEFIKLHRHCKFV